MARKQPAKHRARRGDKNAGARSARDAARASGPSLGIPPGGAPGRAPGVPPEVPAGHRRLRAVAIALFLLSGVAGLGYQVAWTRMLAVGLGHEMPSLVAVVAGFLGGLALGSMLLDGPISRSRRPGRWFAACEIVVAAWAVTVAFAAPAANALAHDLLGATPSPAWQWTVAFGLPFVLLLPATVAMGGTLPAMERLVARLSRRGTEIGGLYAVNTLGAAVGVVLTAFVVLPALGLRGTAVLLAALDLACAMLVLAWPAAGEHERDEVDHAIAGTPGRLRLGALLAGTGLLGIGYEIVGVRVLGQVLESTVYTFASTLAVWLCGTALGAALWHRLVDRRGAGRTFAPAAARLLAANAAGMLAGALLMPAARPVFDGVQATLAPLVGLAAGAIAGELAVATLVFGPVTVAMGATFTHLALAARRRTGGIGRAAGINVLAGAAAPLVVGVLLYPRLGPAWTLSLLAIGEIALLVLVLAPNAHARPQLRGALGALAVALVVASVAAGTRDLALVAPPANMKLVDVRPGLLGTVAVSESSPRARLLKVDDRFSMGGTARSFGDRRQGHLPLLLHPAPRRVLFLGVGAGLTAGAAALHDVEITAVELVPEVLEVQSRFAPQNRTGEIDRLLVADARRFVRAETQAAAPGYDVIVADLFHPARDGAGSLYTREHFQAIADRLDDGGIFCQWLPLHQLGPRELETIVRTFLSVFDPATAWLSQFNARTPVLGLVGARGRADYPAEDVITRAAGRDARLLPELVTLAMERPIDVLGSLVLEHDGLAALAGPGPLNVDDRPIVTYQAPWHTYATEESGRDAVRRLVAAAGGARERPGVLENPEPQDPWGARVAAYRLARDRYLLAVAAADAGDVEAAWSGLLGAAAASRDFTVAVTVALEEVSRLADAGDLGGAQRRIRDLAAARPDAPRVRELSLRLGVVPGR